MHSCLDLAYSMRIICQFYNNPRSILIELVKHVLQYISGILDLSLKFDGKTNIPNDMIGYIISNFMESKTDWKLIEDYVFMLVEPAISHLFKLLLVVTLLTHEAEYITMYKIGKKMVWMGYLLAKQGF